MDGDHEAPPPGVPLATTAPFKQPASFLAQIEASKVRLISSRNLCRNSDVLIRESRATIVRSLERLSSRPGASVA